jgi:hypothetical protein
MKKLYFPLCQKFLLFCFLLLGSYFTMAQTLPDPTGLPSSQIVDYGEQVSLTGSCPSGQLKWYEEVLATPALTDLNPIITETTTYIAVCQALCGCGTEISNAIEVVFTVDKPYNVTRTKSVCECNEVTLQASCPRGEVKWYLDDSTTPLTYTTLQLVETRTYNVRCENTATSYESPFESVTIYAYSTLNDPPTSITPPTTVCLGGSLTLSASCSGDAEPFYFLNDEVTEIDPAISTITANTTYKVRCESLTACPSGFATINVEVSSPPLPTSVTPDDTICQGGIITLAASCDTDSYPQWYLDNEITKFYNPSVFPSVTTTYKVRCESSVYTDCYGPFASTEITVLSDITAQPSSILACLGNKTMFVVGVTGTPAIQWQKRQSNGTYADIPFATNDTLTIDSTTIADRGYYRAHIIGTCNFFTEDAFLALPQTIKEKGKLIPTQVTMGDEFGNAVALSDSLAVVGAWSKSYNKGAAYVYKMSADGKWSQMAQLAPSDLSAGDSFGSAMAISGDTLFVSAVDQSSGRGAVYMFRELPDNSWTQMAKLTFPSVFGVAGSGDYFGASISVADGFMAIGADGREAVYTYLRNGITGEYEPVQELADGSGGTEFGFAVGVSGNSLVVGDPGEGSSGAIYVYHRDNLGHSYLDDVFTPDGLDSGVDFGQAVAVSGNAIIASGVELSHTGEGVAYIYERDAAGKWSEKTKLVSNDITDNAAYGYSIGIHDNIAIVGAYANDFGKGAAVVFERNAAGNWVQKKLIIPSDVQLGDQFGKAVGVSGTSLLSAASFDPLTPTLTFLKGAAHFYQLYTYPAARVEAVAQVAAVCSGQKAVFNLTGMLSRDAYTITYKIDAAGTEKTVVVTPDSTGKASFSETLQWANNGQNIFITKVKNNATNCVLLHNISSEILVKAPTQITGNPERQIVCVGETAVFMAEATGEGILNFQWQRQAPSANGFNSPLGNDFSDISVLTLANRTLADNGAKYRVKVTGECGVVTSTDAPLMVLAKATVIMTAGVPVCPGSGGTLNFTGTPFAHVVYQSNNFNSSVSLDADGRATVTTNPLSAQTTFNLVSIDVEGKCNKTISGSAVIEVLPSGSTILPPVVLASPTDDVASTVVQARTAQSLQATNKILAGGKATHTGNKYILLGQGFEAEQGSVFEAKVMPACP